MMGGGNCARGAASQVISKWVSVKADGGLIATTVAGGTASVITGGKFASGALTAAYGYMFNLCMTAKDCWAEAQQQVGETWAKFGKAYAETAATVLGVVALAPAAPEAVAVNAAAEFFEGAVLHPRVAGPLMKKLDLHGFPASVDTFAAESGTVTKVVDSRGASVDMLTIKGEYKGITGTFEYIKNQANVIYHRFFRPD
jgi:hypothetical protein